MAKITESISLFYTWVVAVSNFSYVIHSGLP